MTRLSLKTGYSRFLSLLAAAFLAACSPAPGPAPIATVPLPQSAQSAQEFTGTLTVSGTRQALGFADRERAATFRLSGSALLQGPKRPNLGFRVEFIGFADSRMGLVGRGVWTDERGDQAFSELRAEQLSTDKPINGRFTGGTGRYLGLRGEYRFTWRYMGDAEDGTVTGRVTDLRGKVYREASTVGGQS